MLTLRKARGRVHSPPPDPIDETVEPEALPEIPVQLSFFPKQVDFIVTTEFLSAMVGGIGGGKTTALMGWVVGHMHSERGTGTVGGIFANTYSQLSQSTLPELWAAFDRLGFEHGRDYVYNEAPPAYWNFKSRFKKKHDAVLTVRWWGQAIVRSLDNPKSIRGTTLGWACLDEARDTDRSSVEIVFGRVRCPLARKHKVRIATSPNGFDWVYEMFVEKPAKDSRLIQIRTLDNPFISLEYVERLRGLYDARLAEQELEGKFVPLTAGAVYRCFDRKIHLDPQNEPVANEQDDYYVSFDFNRTPFCAVLCQPRTIDGVRGLVVLDEAFLEDADTYAMCRHMIDVVLPRHRRAPDPNKPALGAVRVYGDPSGRSRTTKNNFSDYDIITREFRGAYGPDFIASWASSDPGIIPRVNAVNALLLNAKGKCRCKIHSRCIKLIRDFEQVRFKPGTSNIDKEGDKNKMLSHISDAFAYLCDREFPVVSRAAARVTL